MGYRSYVALKTTTEGYLVLKMINKKIISYDSDKPLTGATVQKTESGFYKISFDDIKWYKEYPNVKHFMEALHELDEQDIPYSFVRLGEEYDDIEFIRNYTDDSPDEIYTFEPNTEIYDESEGSYEEVKEDD